MSRALAIVDELDDTAKKRYHWAVFQNKRLLGFLTRGDIRHFLYADDYFPHETLELLDEEPEFRAFLSKPFARQYNLVLTRAIERQLLPVVEVLFDGRRWVDPEDEDVCFEGTLKRVQALVEQMEDMARRSPDTKFTVAQIEQFLSQETLVEIFNLLPTSFRGEQRRFVAAMRSVAIDCHNEHDDSETSAAILNLCKRFQFKNVDLNKRIEDDTKAIESILKEKEKQKVFANLKPIKAAPSLNTTNGIGFQLYGHADYDNATASYIATYFFVFFGIPIFPIRRYRVCSLAGGYRFFGSLPLSVANKWHLFISLAFLACLTIYIVANTAPSDDSYEPPSAYRPSAPGTSTSESKTAYRVPSIRSELESERKAIEVEKAKVERMASELESLYREIERDRVYLDQSSQFKIDAFNRKVNNYNGLVEKAREQNRFVSEMTDRYNKKLQN
jgi:hypothetical protein